MLSSIYELQPEHDAFGVTMGAALKTLIDAIKAKDTDDRIFFDVVISVKSKDRITGEELAVEQIDGHREHLQELGLSIFGGATNATAILTAGPTSTHFDYIKLV